MSRYEQGQKTWKASEGWEGGMMRRDDERRGERPEEGSSSTSAGW